MSQEGGLKAPKRLPIPSDDPLFYDEEDFEAELRRVADICHGCRRCFNLCATFPKLFDAIDASSPGEVDGLTRADFQPSIDACTLCDMCFMVKCPYVPPHPLNVDFPHLMLRARAIAARKKGVPFAQNQLTKTDRNGRMGCVVPKIANWATKTTNKPCRALMEKATGIDRRAEVPRFNITALPEPPAPNPKAPSFGAKVVLYSTCFTTYHDHKIAQAAMAVLAHNGAEVHVVYPECCGMPRFEMGLIDEVSRKTLTIANALVPFIKSGHSVVSLVPSCTLMLTKEAPLLHPNNNDVQLLAENTFDITTYLVRLAKTSGLMPRLADFRAGIFLHIPCHARAQNLGRKAEDMLKLLPNTPLKTMERCSGHGGSWGMMKNNFDNAMKVGQPVMRAINKEGFPLVASECPLAAMHLAQGCSSQGCGQSDPTSVPPKTTDDTATKTFVHPIQIMAHAWGLIPLPEMQK